MQPSADALLGLGVAVVSALLVTAGSYKLANPTLASSAMRQLFGEHNGVGAPLVRLSAAAELATGLALLAPSTVRAGAVITLGFGGLFACLGLTAVLVKNDRVPCGCFGSGVDDLLGPKNIVLGSLLVAVAALVWMLPVGISPLTAAYSAITAGALACAQNPALVRDGTLIALRRRL